MKDVHYQEDDFEKAEKSIGNLIGKGAWGKGAIDSLKDVSKNLEEVEKDIARWDADGAISFSHTNNKSKYQSLFEDFEVLYDFAGEAGNLVEDKIDQPFYEALDEFVEGMRDLDASKFTTKNRIGATTTVTSYANSYTQEQIEVPKKEVSLDDLFSGDNYYADQMKVQYEEWKRQNKDQDVSQKDFRSAMINSRAFEYTSIKDEQQKKEFWVNVVATVAIVGVSIFCPPAGLALGLAYGGLEMSAAVSGKDWLTGREMDTSERVMRGAFSLLDIVPGMKAFSGGTQAIRSGTKLASLSDNLLHGVKSIPSKADDLIKLGKSKALTRINSLKTTVKEGIHTGVERTTKGLDKVGEVADNFKNNLNLNSRRQLAADGFGALPAGGTSKVTNAAEKMKDVLRKYDLNLNGGGRQTDDIIKETSKVFEPEKVTLKNGETAYKSSRGELVRSPDFLDEAGEIKWPDADGFVCDSAGNPITVDANLKAGQIVDRFGNSAGRFTSPVENGKILDYDTRGLPYPESAKAYHQYTIVNDITETNIKNAYNNATPAVKKQLDRIMGKFGLDFKDLASIQKGQVAEVFGAGGGQQIKFITDVKYYEMLGLVKEVN
ncbi:glycohydrolase toxin TNT-related protein [Listeria aquatica]|uniref:glycohydrolase toxin TNT-related protein n=1 Tax=Listeria aquatica TaxID=1494960 RepID=UPI003F4A9DD2